MFFDYIVGIYAQSPNKFRWFVTSKVTSWPATLKLSIAGFLSWRAKIFCEALAGAKQREDHPFTPPPEHMWKNVRSSEGRTPFGSLSAGFPLFRLERAPLNLRCERHQAVEPWRAQSEVRSYIACLATSNPAQTQKAGMPYSQQGQGTKLLHISKFLMPHLFSLCELQTSLVR